MLAALLSEAAPAPPPQALVRERVNGRARQPAVIERGRVDPVVERGIVSTTKATSLSTPPDPMWPWWRVWVPRNHAPERPCMDRTSTVRAVAMAETPTRPMPR